MAAAGFAGDFPSVSVVIPTRDRRRDLERTLRALWDEPGVHEIVVVDDGSTDGTAEWLETQAALRPRIRPVRASGLGPNDARALGARQATGDVILFLDDDEEARPGLVVGHARHHASQEHRLVAGYNPIPVTRETTTVERLVGEWWEELFDLVEAAPEIGLEHVWGGNLSIRSDDLQRIGLSMPEFSGRKDHEDRAFGLRCKRAGLGYVFDRTLRAEHHYIRTVAQFRRDARNSGYGTVLVHRAHPELGDVPAVFWTTERPPLLLVLRLTDSALPREILIRSLQLVIAAADRLQRRELGTAACRLLYRIERRRGFKDASRDIAAAA